MINPMCEIILKQPVFMCAGEPSGDMYAGLLIKKLKKKISKLNIYGVGGSEMRKSGVEVVMDYKDLMAFGFTSGISSVFKNYRIYTKIAQKLYEMRPKTFIAVAYPGMNLLLCQYAKKLGCAVYYFLPPQIWAWGEFRKFFIKKWVDIVISVFPFEYVFYRQRGIESVYFENPLFDELKKFKRSDVGKRIGFMPGSRQSEIKRNLPLMVELMKIVAQERIDVEFYLILYFESSQRLCSSFPYAKIITENRYQAMKNCDLLITSSGTASLEAEIMKIPQIFVNRPSFFDWYVSRRFLKINEYNLANVYFNKKIIPSYVLYDTHDILSSVHRLIRNHVA